MNKRIFALLLLPLALAGCKEESEGSCSLRLLKMVNDTSYRGMGVEKASANVSLSTTILQIERNPDLNVCDYTVLGNNLVKID